MTPQVHVAAGVGGVAPLATSIDRSRWQALFVRLGKRRARAAFVGFSVLASLLAVVAFMAVVRAPMVDWSRYLVPALVIPLVASPVASHFLFELVFGLDAAYALMVQQEQQLASVIEHAPIGIARVDRDGRVRSANPRLRALLAESGDLPLPDWSSVFVSVDALAEFSGALKASQAVEVARWQWFDARRQQRTVRAALVPMPTGAQAAHASGAGDAVLLAEDVTEREAMEAQSLRAQKLELVGQLAGGIAHDFNNLLTIVRGSVAALGGTADSRELGAIDDAAAAGARLVRRLLSISRHDLHTRAPHDAALLLSEAAELMQRVIPERINIRVTHAVPDATVDIDRDAVQQALLNLAVNARDAIEGAGTIALDVRHAEYRETPMLVIGVQDDGHGMTADVRAQATEPFFTTKAADAGTGLGLAMVSGTMRHHDGRLVLESAPGQGTRVELWFPVLPRTGTTEATPTVIATPATTTSHAREASDVVARLLLVEDEPGVRAATERALRRLGYAVTSTADMSSAFAHISSGAAIDLVLSDVMMPGGTGVDLLHTVRGAGHTMPFLLVSGYAVDDLDGLRAADPRVGLLAKPWSSASLDAPIRQLLALGDHERARELHVGESAGR